jgi:flagellar hook-basal body complex protein FliE
MVHVELGPLLDEMRALGAQAQGQAQTLDAEHKEVPEFSALLKQAVDDVNRLQQEAKALAESFERGDPNVGVPEVMVSLQKANVAFQAVTQVRNRLIRAYQDVMNMPI